MKLSNIKDLLNEHLKIFYKNNSCEDLDVQSKKVCFRF